MTRLLLDAKVARLEALAGRYPESFKPPPYSTDWKFGGPIIEREQISLTSIDHRHPALDWHARIPGTLQPGWEPAEATGRSPLIAAMRAYIASYAPGPPIARATKRRPNERT